MKPLAYLARHRNLLLLAAAVGLGGLAAFGARGYLSEQLAIERERLAPRQPMLQVVVAKRDLARGEAVSADTMAVREVPREYLPAGTVTPERFDAVAGATLVQPMRAGEPLQQLAVAQPDAGAFSARLRSGVRALTIGVDEVNSLSGMLQPGDRIDLMLSVRLPGGSGTPLPQEVTRALMQDVRVLATGRQVRPGGDERQAARAYTAITIEVTPEQAQRLVVAQRSGKLTAMLRNPGDREPIAQRPMDVYGLLGLGQIAAEPARASPPEVIVGGQGPLRNADRLAQAMAQAAGTAGAAAGNAVAGASGAAAPGAAAPGAGPTSGTSSTGYATGTTGAAAPPTQA
ncbi:MAG TPA: Flp pilus assembly protein CpaB, partial [Quisquiliibacterium sp.]|nr:Flp pilus assembly protein CpaB [Quisquiliibacterium sp.]